MKRCPGCGHAHNHGHATRCRECRRPFDDGPLDDNDRALDAKRDRELERGSQ